MPKRITKIPFPGDSGAIPTGAIQFQDDWPGLFLRGDSAIPVAVAIRHLQERLSTHPDSTVKAAISQLGEIAALIEDDVRLL